MSPPLPLPPFFPFPLISSFVSSSFSFHFFPSSLSFLSSFFLALFLSPLTPPLSPPIQSSFHLLPPLLLPTAFLLPLLHLLSSILVASLPKLPSTFFSYCTSTSSHPLLIHLLFYLLPAFLFSISLSQISLYLSYYAFFFLFLLLFNPLLTNPSFFFFLPPLFSFFSLFKLYLPILVCKKNFFLD